MGIKSELAKLYTKLTGLTANIDDMISNASDDTEKKSLFKHLNWHIKRGTVVSTEGEQKENFAKVLSGLANSLDIDPENPDLNSDGVIDDTEQRIGDEIKSSIEIVEDLGSFED